MLIVPPQKIPQIRYNIVIQIVIGETCFGLRCLQTQWMWWWVQQLCLLTKLLFTADIHRQVYFFNVFFSHQNTIEIYLWRDVIWSPLLVNSMWGCHVIFPRGHVSCIILCWFQNIIHPIVTCLLSHMREKFTDKHWHQDSSCSCLSWSSHKQKQESPLWRFY